MKIIHKYVHHRCTIFSRVKKANGSWILLPIIVLPLVVTKRVKVANELYNKSDGQLLTTGRAFVIDMTTNVAIFTAPTPVLTVVTSALNLFESLMNTAKAVPTSDNIRDRNNQKEVVLNTLSALGNYVEDVANSAGTDPISIIEKAGMRAKTFTNRRRKSWNVTQGRLTGTLQLTAAAIRNGSHEWAYTTTPTVDTSWVMIPSTRADMLFTGLTPGSFVSCRHRSVTKNGPSNWEGHDPVVVI